MPGESARINGRKGGRPKGGKNDALAAIVRERYAKAGEAVAMAQIQLAIGCQRVYRTVKGGKVIRVTDEEQIFKFLNGGAESDGYYMVSAVDADSSACDSVQNRAFGKPKEQHEHTIPEGVVIRHVLERV